MDRYLIVERCRFKKKPGSELCTVTFHSICYEFVGGVNYHLLVPVASLNFWANPYFVRKLLK